ncbi:MAG: hypothetical protein ACMUEL_04385 [Flavobacteriales bacterium Tduv]
MGNRTDFWQYKALVWIRKGSYKGLARVHSSILWKLCCIICIVPWYYYSLFIKIDIFN